MKLKELETSELINLRDYLEILGEEIRTGQVYWEFEARLFECEGVFSDISEVVELAYPDARLDLAQIPEGSVEVLNIALESERGRFLPHLISNYILGIWPLLEACIDYNNSRMFRYLCSEQDNLLHGIVGYFAVIIYNENLRRCLFLSGSTDT